MPFLGSALSLPLLNSLRTDRCCLLLFGAVGMWFLSGEPMYQLVFGLTTLLVLALTFFWGEVQIGTQVPEVKQPIQRNRSKPIGSPRYPEYLEPSLNPGEHFRSKVSEVKVDG